MERVPVAVVGGGQAGLATSHELSVRQIEHVVLERGQVGQAWRDRWDSFCLVTPNWSVRLPGRRYDGPDPDGYLPRDEIVEYLERYAASFGAPVRGGADVRSVALDPAGRFILRTTSGDLAADAVVVATGAYQRPHRPAGAATLPRGLAVLDVTDYRNPAALPPGAVLVVGSGQSGCQLAEELAEAGRDVVLACGKAPWAPRRIGGRDMYWWAVESGFMDAPLGSLPTPAARLGANLQASGHHGGRDLHLRTLQAIGVTLAGHFLGATDGYLHFAPDLPETVAWGDERYAALMNLVRKVCAERGLPRPEIPAAEPLASAGPERVPLARFGAVVFAGGFRPEYRSWLPWANAFDEIGFPIQHDGASTVIGELYFVGVHFLRTRKSSLLLGVGEDAAIVAGLVALRLGTDRRADA